METIDTAAPVRPGEELDTRALEAFLREQVPGLGGEIRILQFPGGFSNLTYLIQSGDRQLVLRRPPIGAAIASAHDMGREYRMLTALRPVFPFCPRPLAYTEDTGILGAPFYIMEKLTGIILRKELPEGLSYTPDEAGELCRNLVDLQVRLHDIDTAAAGLSFLGKPEGYVERQVNGWSERYRNARTDDAPDFETVMGWLAENRQPDTDRPSLVHNDYKFDNVVLSPEEPTRPIGVLDWEMATLGDPLMDLGSSLAYWVEKGDSEEMQLIRLMPTHLDGALTRKEIVGRYAELTGRDVGAFDFYYCFGLFRLAVIAQQIYSRYYRGLTRDKRFAMLIGAVQILERASLRVMETADIPGNA